MNCTITITADLALLVDPTRIFQLIHRCAACNMDMGYTFVFRGNRILRGLNFKMLSHLQ